MTSTSLSANVHSIITNFSKQSFSQTKTNMSFIHQRKISLFMNQLQIQITNFFNCITSTNNCIVLSNSSNNLIFLNLIINNRYFLFTRIQKLFSEERITTCNYYSQGIHFRSCARNSLSDHHHCCITYLRISFCLYLACFTDRYKFTKHISFGNDYITHNQISIVFCCKTYLRPYISYLNSW